LLQWFDYDLFREENFSLLRYKVLSLGLFLKELFSGGAVKGGDKAGDVTGRRRLDLDFLEGLATLKSNPEDVLIAVVTFMASPFRQPFFTPPPSSLSLQNVSPSNTSQTASMDTCLSELN
jgi:hypothetical protein